MEIKVDKAIFFVLLVVAMTTKPSIQVRRIDVESTIPENIEWNLCLEDVPQFQVPCLCAKIVQSIDVGVEDGVLTLNGTNVADGSGTRYIFDCDGVSLPGNVPVLPLRMPVHGYSHRFGGFQTFPRQLFAASDVPLMWADFGHNHLQRLSDRFLEGVEKTLEELYLGNNCLGHQLNPIFATSAFNSLTKLRILDLSYNTLKDLDDALFQGLDNLEELRLDGNHLRIIPGQKLQNLPRMAVLDLQHNQIDHIKKHEFSMLTTLERLNISHNIVTVIEHDAFSYLTNLTHLDLSSNQISSLENEEIFSGLFNLMSLDLSDNFLTQVPSRALRSMRSLKNLRLSSNGIRELRLDDFAEFSNLEIVDLSRNRIAELPPTVFSRLSNLRRLLLDVNLVRKIEDPAFEGLHNLEHLSMNDNTVLGLPNGALAAVPSLRRLSIGHNRIAAISPDLLRTVRNVLELDLQYNLVRELLNGTFQNFTALTALNLRGNRIKALTRDTFVGADKTLMRLDLSANELGSYPDFSPFLNLEALDLSDNRISSLAENFMLTLPSIRSIDLARNRLVELTASTFNPPPLTATTETISSLPYLLETLDLSGNRLKSIPNEAFASLRLLENLDLSENRIREIEEATFQNLPNLRALDLSRNKINTIRPKAFGLELRSLRRLNLSGNALTVLDGAIFSTKIPPMRILDVSANHIHYLIPNALSGLPRLEELNLNENRLTLFLEGLLGELPYLRSLLLRTNHLHQIDGEQFSHARRLTRLDLSDNGIETLGDRIFYNSSQIRHLDLGRNRLTTFPVNLFDGLARLQLNLRNNNLTSLPAGIFARQRVANLQSLDISANQFKRLPLSALNDQYATLEDLLASDNDVSHIPANANSLVNVRRLDLSDNPLDEESIRTIFGEPKTVQVLTMSGCRIKELPRLETPFLLTLNVSRNLITSLKSNGSFQRTTLLSTLDLSENDIRNSSAELSSVWTTIAAELRHLDLSGNPLKELGPRHLSSLKRLESLSLNELHELTRFDDEALSGMETLEYLSIYGYPRLGYYDVSGILGRVPSLKSLEVEIKTNILRDQLHPAYNSRLDELIIRGRALKNLTSVSFAGLLAPTMAISIRGTSVATIPNTIFLPLPNSADITLDLADNRITVLGPQLLMTLSEKLHHVQLIGLDESNSLFCDCNMKPMLAWIAQRISNDDDDDDNHNDDDADIGDKSHGPNNDDRQNENVWKKLNCFGPKDLEMRKVWRLTDEDLTCDRIATTTTTTTDSSVKLMLKPNTNTTTVKPPTTTPTDVFRVVHLADEDTLLEPDIIYESPTPRYNPSESELQNSLTNMDSMIIGIIVGVVAFICILIIIICIVKLRQSRMRYARAGHMMHLGPPPLPPMRNGSGGGPPPCTCTKLSAGGSYQNVSTMHHHHHHPQHPQGTLPRKPNGNGGSVKSLPRSTIGHYNTPNGQPYYVSYSEGDVVDYR